MTTSDNQTRTPKAGRDLPVAIGVGVVAGDAVHRRLDAATGRRLVAAIACLGALATVVRGVVVW